MRKTTLAVVLGGLLAGGASQAAAPDNSWYLGGKAGWSKFYSVEINSDASELLDNLTTRKNDASDFGFGAFVGYQLNPHVGFEVGYDWLGEYRIKGSYEGINLDAKAPAQLVQASVRLIAPLENGVDLYGRLGGAYTRVESKIQAAGLSDSSDDTGAAFVGAVGAEYEFEPNWALRLEYQYTTPLGDKALDKSGIEMNNGLLSLGMIYRFGSRVQPAPEPVVAPQPVQPAPALVPTPHRFSLSSDVLFEFDSARLRPVAHQELDALFGQLVAANPQDGTARIIGHTDRLGSEAYNLRLSQQRAQAVADYLIGKGLVAGKVEVVGMGERSPVTGDRCHQSTHAALVSCLAEDRRVDITLDGVAQK